MKKISLILLLFISFWGCEKDFDTAVDSPVNTYQVTGLSSFSSARYIVNDSLITVYISLNTSAGIGAVYFDIYASDGTKLNEQGVQLLDNGNPANGDTQAGDNRFTNKYPLSYYNPVGLYSIKYYITDSRGNTRQAALHNFIYDNGQTNVAPVISNAIIEPDTLVANDTIPIFTSVNVFDANGSNDIQTVYFIVLQPDGDEVQLELLDDGSCCLLPPTNDATSGDQAEGDDVYTRIIQVDQDNNKGTYLFRFRAKDRGGLLSNIIEYPVLIQ